LAGTALEWETGTDFACEAAKTAASCVDTPSMSQLKHLTVRVAIKRCAQTDVLLVVTQSRHFSGELADGRRRRQIRDQLLGLEGLCFGREILIR